MQTDKRNEWEIKQSYRQPHRKVEGHCHQMLWQHELQLVQWKILCLLKRSKQRNSFFHASVHFTFHYVRIDFGHNCCDGATVRRCEACLNVAYIAAQPCVSAHWNSNGYGIEEIHLKHYENGFVPLVYWKLSGQFDIKTFARRQIRIFSQYFFFSSPKSKRDPILLPSYSI